MFDIKNLPPSAQRALDAVPNSSNNRLQQLEVTAKTCVEELSAEVQLSDHYAEELFHSRSQLYKQQQEIERLRAALQEYGGDAGSVSTTTHVVRTHTHREQRTMSRSRAGGSVAGSDAGGASDAESRPGGMADFVSPIQVMRSTAPPSTGPPVSPSRRSLRDDTPQGTLPPTPGCSSPSSS